MWALGRYPLSESEPSRLLVEQRVRNRLIEYLEMVCAYESDPPPWDLNETVNQWDDWTGGEKFLTEEHFPTPVYSREEAVSLVREHKSLSAFCDSTPQNIVDDLGAFQLPE